MRLLFILAVLAAAPLAPAQVINNWINPASGRWDSAANWSLGSLPAANESVNITNDGYKAVNIDSATVAGFPNSLTVSNLVVAAPSNAQTTLLLNYAGLSTPLKVLNNCAIKTNGTIANQYSSFEVDGAAGGELLVDGGTFTQQGGQSVVNGPVSVLDNGSLYATNANLTLGAVTIGSAPGSAGTFIQDGGSIAAQSIDIEQGATYHLVSGVLYGINGTTTTSGPFVQYGGTNYGNITTPDSYYWLKAGMVQGNTLTAANDAGITQDGGLLDMQFINVTGTSNWPASGGPWFSGGTVHCGTLNIGGNGKVEMRGADFYVTNDFDLHGMYFNVPRGPLIEHVACELWAGSLHLPSMTVGEFAYFDQMGGSNEISGGLSMSAGQFGLYGGTLETTYTGVGAGASFEHGGGQHFVHGVLSVSGTYDLNGGSPQGGVSLVCQGVFLRGTLTMSLYYNGRYFDPAATFTNTGVLNLGGTISTELPDIQAGQVQLATNATIAFSNAFPAVIHFQNSSGIGWTPGAILVITNWSSSYHHVFAGSDASGLNASQLQQVEFSNPAGFVPGMYPVQILSTGEIVPASRPTLTMTRILNALVLTWSGNYQLLEATNVTGPFVPVPGASSPWTNSFTKPQEYFRLQGF
jgi:hypothetical protein